MQKLQGRFPCSFVTPNLKLQQPKGWAVQIHSKRSRSAWIAFKLSVSPNKFCGPWCLPMNIPRNMKYRSARLNRRASFVYFFHIGRKAAILNTFLAIPPQVKASTLPWRAECIARKNLPFGLFSDCCKSAKHCVCQIPPKNHCHVFGETLAERKSFYCVCSCNSTCLREYVIPSTSLPSWLTPSGVAILLFILVYVIMKASSSLSGIV